MRSKSEIGEFTASTTAENSVTVGFTPKYLAIKMGTSIATAALISIYDERYSTTKFLQGTANYQLTSYNLGTSNNNYIKSIDTSGFTLNKVNSTNTYVSYFAIG